MDKFDDPLVVAYKRRNRYKKKLFHAARQVVLQDWISKSNKD